jgi:8-oxo-dGTP pyrophosphatase MutT (NUDIX family)
MNSQKILCLNCGKSGHQFKLCDEPVISYGIACFNIDPKLNISNKSIENYFYNKYIDIEEFNYLNLDNIKLIPHFYDKIKILMIRRKNSMNYIEFLRGKYDLSNKDHLKNIFNLMTKEENLKILNSNFDFLWNELWKDTAKSKIYQKEFNLSKLKFVELKENNFYDLLNDNNLSSYLEAEWGFPKGRRNLNEKNITCAIREFYEETNLCLDHLHILERLGYTEEEYIGTNGIKYKHIYYLASSDKELELELTINNKNQIYEIGDMAWFTIPEALEKIRSYNETKIKMIHQIYFFLINLFVEIENSKKKFIEI